MSSFCNVDAVRPVREVTARWFSVATMIRDVGKTAAGREYPVAVVCGGKGVGGGGVGGNEGRGC